MRTVAWKLVNFLQLLLLGGWTVFWISAALMVSLVTGRAHISLAMARRIWAPGILRGIGVRLCVEGREHVDPRLPAVYVANHRSNLDVPVLFASLPIDLRFVVKAEVGKVPFLGWYVKSTGMVLIDRKRRASARSGLARAADLVASGRSIVTFPEGTRGTGPEPGRFKSGIFAIALRAGVPVIPVAISGTGRAWRPHTLAGRPGEVRVVIGEALDTTRLGRDDRRVVAELARERVLELLADGERRRTATSGRTGAAVAGSRDDRRDSDEGQGE